MTKYTIIMRINLTDTHTDFMLKKVKGEPFSLDSRLFVRYVKEVYHLTDIETGCELTHSSYYDTLEFWYKTYKDQYEVFRNTDSYKCKVKRLKELEQL